MIILLNTENNKQVELTDAELDALYYALNDYCSYGEGEEETADKIQSKLFEINA